MTTFLADSSVLLDIITSDPTWYDWSFTQISTALLEGKLQINPIIYAEIAGEFESSTTLDEWLTPQFIGKVQLPFEAAFRAHKAFMEYRQRGGRKTSRLPDFFIGAQAEIEGLTVITRDESRFRSYFPNVKLISPESIREK
jgi:predicted nucleic acid-binding protein